MVGKRLDGAMVLERSQDWMFAQLLAMLRIEMVGMSSFSGAPTGQT